MKERKKEEVGKAKVLKFNLEEENAIRERSKKFQRLAKQIRHAGFSLKTITSTDTFPEFKRKYKDKPVAIVEFESGKDKIEEIQDFIVSSTKGSVLEIDVYKYTDNIIVNRIFVDCTNV